MNRIYRLIWSVARQGWVVASELSALRGKRRPRAAIAVAAVLLCASAAAHADDDDGEPLIAAVPASSQLPDWPVPTLSMPLPFARGMAPAATVHSVFRQNALTSDASYTDSTISGDRQMVLGSRSVISGSDSVLYGTLSRSVGHRNVVIGNGIHASYNDVVAIGNLAHGGASNVVAVGKEARATAQWATVVGNRSTASGFASAVLGAESTANGARSVALGADSRAQHERSVALGNNSVTSAANQVSVGSGSFKRTIVNVADGAVNSSSSDAVTGRQLHATNQSISGAINTANAANSTANAARTTANDALAKANTVSGLVSQTAANGNVRLGGSNTGTLLDVRNQSGAGRRITGVANGTVSTTSTDAVNGQQLHATNQHAATAGTTANVAQATANDALAKANTVTGLIGQTAANGNVRLGGSNTGTVLDVRNQSNANRRITGVANATLSTTSTEAVSGQQLHTTNQNVTTATSTANTARTRADEALAKANTVSGLVGQTAANGTVRLGGSNSGTLLDVRNSTDATRRIRGVSEGELAENSTDAVNGHQLHATHQQALAAQATAGQAHALATTTGARLDAQALQLGAGAASSGGNAVALGNLAQAEHNGSLSGVAIGSTAKAYAGGGIAVGDDARANVDAAGNRVSTHTGGVALGSQARSGNGGVAGGLRASATGDRAVAIGNDARAAATHGTALGYSAEASANQSTAVGRGSKASQTYATAVGNLAQANGSSSLALGDRSSAEHTGSVALGSGASTTGTYQVSVGSASQKRKVVNVADATLGTASSDAVTGRQLYATNTLVASQGAQIADNRNDIDALREDFEGFDPDLSGVVRFSEDRSRVEMDGARIAGLAEGDISSATSREAVTGGQLFNTNQRVATIEEVSRYLAIDGGSSVPEARAGLLAVAIGGSAEASAEGGVAVGAFALAEAVNSVALGRAAWVHGQAESGFALGARSEVRASRGLAIGGGSLVAEGAIQSVAIGHASVASGPNEVSVGASGLKRRITNAADGIDQHDLATISQLGSAISALGGGAGFAADGSVTAPTYVIQGSDRRNVGDALTALDGAVVAARDHVGGFEQRLSEMDSSRIASEARQVRFSEGRSVVDFGGARLTGLMDGDIGSVQSRDAVTGGQLFGTNSRIGALEEMQKYVAVGRDDLSNAAEVGVLATAVGSDTRAIAEGSTAIGSYSVARAINSVALGRGAHVRDGADEGFALGTRSQVYEAGGLALGGAAVVANGAVASVALGRGSIARESHVVSIGDDGLKRRITNAANGRDGHDLTTVAQLRGAFAALGEMRMDADGNIVSPEFSVQGQRHGTVGDAMAALDTAVVDSRREGAALGQRLDRLFQEEAPARASGVGTLRLGGEQGMVLSNVANGLVAAGSRDAVNGGQLHAVREELSGRIDGLQQRAEADVATAAAQAQTRSETAAETSAPAQDEPALAAAPAAKAAKTAKADDPLPQVDTRALDEAVNRANEYTDRALAGVDRKLDRLDKRLNRMAAMGSAQAAMAMNTAGLQTYNRLGAGVGHAEGESALAVGYQRVLNERGSATFSLNGAFTNSGERTLGVGVGIGW